MQQISLTLEQVTFTLEAVIEAQRKLERIERICSDREVAGKWRNKRHVLDQVRRKLTDCLQVLHGQLMERSGAVRCGGCGLWLERGEDHDCPTP